MVRKTEGHFLNENQGILEIQNGWQALNEVLNGWNEKKIKYFLWGLEEKLFPNVRKGAHSGSLWGLDPMSEIRPIFLSSNIQIRNHLTLYFGPGLLFFRLRVRCWLLFFPLELRLSSLPEESALYLHSVASTTFNVVISCLTHSTNVLLPHFHLMLALVSSACRGTI